MRKRIYDIRRIRSTLSYSVQEVAELFRLHKNAVLNWIKNGLPIIDDRKPYLIQGAQLSEYLKNKQNRRKAKCKTNEFFCFKCRTPRLAKEGTAEIQIKNESKLTIKGYCADCGTRLNRAGAVKKLIEYQKTFSIQKPKEPHIIASVDSIVNSDKKENDKYEQIQC